MKSQLELIAEAVQEELAESSFSLQFIPTLTYDAQLKLEDADTLHVDVVPVRADPERIDRKTIRWTSLVDIGIRYRFGVNYQNPDTGHIDTYHVNRLMYLEQEIVEVFFRESRIERLTDATMSDEPAVRTAWIPKHMAEWSQFTGIIRVTYQTETEIAS